MNAIEAHGLRKQYGKNVALDGLDWSLPVGEACALLGPNGAGKSTALRMMVGFSQPTGGELRVMGGDPWDHDPQTKMRIAFVPENPMLPEWMRTAALFDVHRGLYPRWDGALERELRELLEIPARARIGELSKGQNRRVHLVLALCQGAELLLLDEPGAGLDVAGRRQLLSLLADFLLHEGRTIVVSTHLVTDIERLASRVTMLARGRCVADTPLEELQREVKTLRLPRPVFERMMKGLEGADILHREIAGREAVVTVRKFHSVADAVLRRDLGEGEVVVSQSANADVYVARDATQAQALHLSLEDIFLLLTGATDETATR